MLVARLVFAKVEAEKADRVQPRDIDPHLRQGLAKTGL